MLQGSADLPSDNFTTQEFSMVGGYTEDIEKPRLLEEGGGGVLTGMGVCPGHYGVDVINFRLGSFNISRFLFSRKLVCRRNFPLTNGTLHNSSYTSCFDRAQTSKDYGHGSPGCFGLACCKLLVSSNFYAMLEHSKLLSWCVPILCSCSNFLVCNKMIITPQDVKCGCISVQVHGYSSYECAYKAVYG